VEPLRGQMISLSSRSLGHVVYGAGGYAVPREDGRTLIGATSERAGFDAGHTPEGTAALRAMVATLSPALAAAPLLEAWAGLRPMTPDGLPIVGPEPANDVLVYACGHSRNGVLLAPVTGACVAALLAGTAPPLDLSPYRVERFTAGAGAAVDLASSTATHP
jgi:glycine oxidase